MGFEVGQTVVIKSGRGVGKKFVITSIYSLLSRSKKLIYFATDGENRSEFKNLTQEERTC